MSILALLRATNRGRGLGLLPGAARALQSSGPALARARGGSEDSASSLPTVINGNEVLPDQAPTQQDPWLAVRDKASGGIYWWNPGNDQVTAVGDPKPLQPVLPPASTPGPFDAYRQYQAQAPLGDLLKQNLVMGLGFGAAVAFVAALFR